MRIITNELSGANDLYLRLDSIIRQIIKRNVSYNLYTYTDKLGAINLMITSNRGTNSKTVIVQYNELTGLWSAHTSLQTFELDSLGQVSNLCKRLLQKMRTTLNHA